MGFPLKPPPTDSVPAPLRRWFSLFSAWARDRERFEKSVTSGAEFKSASERLALKRGIVVDSSRVADMGTDSPTVSLTGDLIPSADNTYDVGSPTFRYADIHQAGTAYLAGVSASGLTVGGNANVSGGLSVSGFSFATATGGTLTLSGTLTGTILNLSTLGATNLIVGAGGISDIGGLTVSGYAYFATGATFDGAIGCSDIIPLNGTLTGRLGRTNRRWAEVYGGTATLTYGVVTGGTFHCAAQDPAAVVNRFGGNFDIGGTAGITGRAEFSGGVSISGGLTSSGQIGGLAGLTLGGLAVFSSGVSSLSTLTAQGQGQFLAGITVTGGVTIGGMVFISSAPTNGFTGNLLPITNLTGTLGSSPRRWAQVFGGTLTVTNSVISGGTLTFTGAHAHSIQGTLSASDLSVAGVFSTASVNPTVDISGQLGEIGFINSSDLRWSACCLGGPLITAKGADIASGTTLSYGIDGNYFDVTGVSTIAGITYSGTQADPQAGIVNIVRLDSNPSFAHHATRLQLSGSTDFAGYTGDHLMLVSDGSGNWREAFRSYRPMAYGSCSSAGADIGFSVAGSSQNTWYEVTDADMADGVLSLVTHDGSGELTVTRPGVYLINYNVTMSSDVANTAIQSSIFISGSGISEGFGSARTTTATYRNQLSGTAIKRLATNATIDVRVRHEDAAVPTLSVQMLDITATQIGW